jgi:hypothetical protein
MSIYFIIGIVIMSIVLLIRIFRVRIVRWLLKVRAGLKIHSLRRAIRAADKDKAETQRKNIVVLNTSSGEFEPLTKRLLKVAEKKGKNNSNAKLTEFRKKNFKRKRKYLNQSVNEIEKKSLYVTN